MTNPVIENVRLSLRHTGDTPLSSPPEIIAPRQPLSLEDEIEVLFRELARLSAIGQRLNPGRVPDALKTLVAEQKITKAAVWSTRLLTQLHISDCLRSLGVELISPNAEKHALAQCDLGVTEADFILPETGTLVLRSSVEKPRAVSLLPRAHLAITTRDTIRADLHQVFSESKTSPYLVFITGPSRTSDIELTPTLGMHGPKYLSVYLIDEFNPNLPREETKNIL